MKERSENMKRTSGSLVFSAAAFLSKRDGLTAAFAVSADGRWQDFSAGDEIKSTVQIISAYGGKPRIVVDIEARSTSRSICSKKRSLA